MPASSHGSNATPGQPDADSPAQACTVANADLIQDYWDDILGSKPVPAASPW